MGCIAKRKLPILKTSECRCRLVADQPGWLAKEMTLEPEALSLRLSSMANIKQANLL